MWLFFPRFGTLHQTGQQCYMLDHCWWETLDTKRKAQYILGWVVFAARMNLHFALHFNIYFATGLIDGFDASSVIQDTSTSPRVMRLFEHLPKEISP